MRKHTQQMSPAERGFIHGYIRANVTRVTGAPHFYDRASDRHFTFVEALDAVRGGLVVEIHNNRAPEIRVLLRNQKGTCAVLNLQSWDIVTVYYNDPEDKHETLDWSPYRWTQDVVALVKNLRRAACENATRVEQHERLLDSGPQVWDDRD